LSFGVEAGWISLTGLPNAEKAERYAGYMQEHTHYRPLSRLQNDFLTLFTEFDTSLTGDLIARKSALVTLMRATIVRRLIENASLRFNTSAITLRK
jgi:hypothetical protein